MLSAIMQVHFCESYRNHRFRSEYMGLHRLDYLIIAAYLTGITLFGLQFRKRQRSLKDYFLADRNIPWWAIALSIVRLKPAP